MCAIMLVSGCAFSNGGCESAHSRIRDPFICVVHATRNNRYRWWFVCVTQFIFDWFRICMYRFMFGNWNFGSLWLQFSYKVRTFFLKSYPYNYINTFWLVDDSYCLSIVHRWWGFVIYLLFKMNLHMYIVSFASSNFNDILKFFKNNDLFWRLCDNLYI